MEKKTIIMGAGKIIHLPKELKDKVITIDDGPVVSFPYSLPPTLMYNTEMTREERKERAIYDYVYNHLNKNHLSIMDEYLLIKMKKSTLPVAHRNYIVNQVETPNPKP